MTERPIFSESRRKPVRAAVGLILLMLLLALMAIVPMAGADDHIVNMNNNTVNADDTTQQTITPISNRTLTADEEGKAKLAAIEPILRYKANMTEWQRKISSNLLQIVDPDYPASGMTVSQKKDMMQRLMQLIPAENVTTELNVSSDPNKKYGDHVTVYILLNQSASPQAIAPIIPYTTKIVAIDMQTVVAWVDINNIVNLAKRDDVMRIELADRGVTSNTGGSAITNNAVNNGNFSLQPTNSQVIETSATSATFSPTTPSSSLSILGILSALFLLGLILMKFGRT